MHEFTCQLHAVFHSLGLLSFNKFTDGGKRRLRVAVEKTETQILTKYLMISSHVATPLNNEVY